MDFNRLLIIDNTLRNSVGHHYEYAKAVHDAAKQRGLDVHVICNANPDESVRKTLNVIPAFRFTMHDIILSSKRFRLISEVLNAALSTFRFLRDWKTSGVSHLVDSHSLIFIPTCTEVSSFGILLWTLMQKTVFRPRLVCLFRLEIKSSLMVLVGRLMALLVRRDTLLPATDSTVLADDYSKVTHLQFDVLPIPHLPVPFDKEQARVSHGGPVRIVFLGDARAEKGVDVLAASLGLLSTELSNRHVEFVIQCYISPVDRQLTETVVQVLMKSVQSIDRGIELVENHLDTKTYYQLLNEADAIIMPYRRVFYRARTSGILAEAIAAGKPVIVPRETWMSQQARDYGACVEFEDGNPADLARAIRKLIETHHALREQAERRSLHWREMHTADNLLDIMISHWSRSLNHVQS